MPHSHCSSAMLPHAGGRGSVLNGMQDEKKEKKFWLRLDWNLFIT